MAEKKPILSERVEALEVTKEDGMVRLSTVGISADFFAEHWEHLLQAFPHAAADCKKFAQDKPVSRTDRRGFDKLFQDTLKRAVGASSKSKTLYIRWIATLAITWLKFYLPADVHPVAAIDYFHGMKDDEIAEENTQRARQLLTWQYYCLKHFVEIVDET